MTLTRLITLSVLAHFVFVSARMTGSLYALQNKASAFTVGVLMALFALVPMLLAVRAGRWLDAVGPWKPLALGAGLIMAGIALPALFAYAATDVAPLLVMACLVGTGAMLMQLTVQNLVGHQTEPAERATAFSWLAMGASISGLTGPVASGFLIDGIGHRATFAVLAVTALAMPVLLWWHRAQLPSRTPTEAPSVAPPLFDLFQFRAVRDVLIAGGLISMAWDLQTFMVPVYGTGIGLAASQIGLVLGAFASATFAIRLAMPWLARTFREWQVLTFTLAAAALAFALMPLFANLWALMACAFLLGLGLGSAQPNLLSLLHVHTPAGRVGEALGVRTTIMNGSHVVLPLVFGAFGSVVGAAAVFWIMAAVLAAGGVFAGRRAGSRAHDPAPSSAEPPR
jgi:MFS family permease